MLGVVFAFISTRFAHGSASLDSGSHSFQIRFGLAGDDPPGRKTQVRAIEVKSNASPHVGYVFFAEASVRA
jgi:hypothetical protein